MKTRAGWLLFVACAAACSSSPSAGTPEPGAGGDNAGGQAGTATITAGSGGAGGSPTSGGGAGGAATAGTAGSGGSVAGGASGGSGGGAAGAGGALGVAGSAGAAGAPNLPNMIPAGYTGTPFGGTPQTIPGKIEIEKYDLGGANVAYNADAGTAFNRCGLNRTDAIKLQCTQQPGPSDKTDPGCGVEPAGQVYLGYINGGNWYKYTVNVLEAGTYVISGHEGVAGKPQMQFTFTDALKTAPLPLPSTDVCNFEAYHVWAVQDNLGEITLTPGKYVLTITVVAAGMNLDWFAFTKK